MASHKMQNEKPQMAPHIYYKLNFKINLSSTPKYIFLIFFTKKVGPAYKKKKPHHPKQNQLDLHCSLFFLLWFSVVIQIYNTTCNRRKEIISKHSKKVNI